MGFLGVYKAIYEYVPQGESELAISEGDILYVLEKSGEDDWWRAKKKASGDDDDEPVGLIPNNYIEEVSGIHGMFICLLGCCVVYTGLFICLGSTMTYILLLQCNVSRQKICRKISIRNEDANCDTG
jgi:hypothetical protein